MVKIVPVCLLIFLTLLSLHRLPAQEPAAAKVYVYRYKQYVGSFLQPSVYCDEAQLARIGNGQFFLVSVEPGDHTFRSNDKQSGVRADMKPGEDYYLRVEIATGALKGHGRIVLVPKEQGAFEVGKLKPLPPENVKDHIRVSP